MPWDKIRNLFRRARKTIDDSNAPNIPWLEAANNPWGVDVFDVRPVTLTMLSTSKDPRCATNAISFTSDDGTGFIGQEPPVTQRIETALRYRIDNVLADGALFIPEEMEHKWALYFHGSTIICVRSWLREVQAVAHVRLLGDIVEIYEIQGTLVPDSEDPQLSVRALDFLIRTHALDLTYPAPLPAGMDTDGYSSALWCMSLFGNRAHFASTHAPDAAIPEKPLRTQSLLHIAVARGDIESIDRYLEGGIPIDLLAADGLAPVHWALARDTPTAMEHLLAKGALVDVRSTEGATPLMNAVQQRSFEKARSLIARGADVNATDQRGFTSMHRAAEMGETDLVALLLEHGAEPSPLAEGQTPLSLAQGRNEREVIALLGRRKPNAS